MPWSQLSGQHHTYVGGTLTDVRSTSPDFRANLSRFNLTDNISVIDDFDSRAGVPSGPNYWSCGSEKEMKHKHVTDRGRMLYATYRITFLPVGFLRFPAHFLRGVGREKLHQENKTLALLKEKNVAGSHHEDVAGVRQW